MDYAQAFAISSAGMSLERARVEVAATNLAHANTVQDSGSPGYQPMRVVARAAVQAGADYVAFGAFYPSSTKASEHRPEPEILAWWQHLFEIPCVAIGGITPENCGDLVRAGADFLAVSGAVWNGDEEAAVRAFHEALAAVQG